MRARFFGRTTAHAHVYTVCCYVGFATTVLLHVLQHYTVPPSKGVGGGGRGGGGVPIYTPMIRLETAENHRVHCLMPSDDFIVKKPDDDALLVWYHLHTCITD